MIQDKYKLVIVSTIRKMALATGLVAVSYFVGLRQNPSFQELPERARHAIVEQHQTADTLLTQAVNEYKRGNQQKAFELYWQCKKEEAPLEKIDPQYEELETRLFRYSAAIIDTGLSTKDIDDTFTIIVAGTPERIAEYVFSPRAITGSDQLLETIGPDSGAYHRLEGDREVQKSLLRYYVEYSQKWYDASEQMRTKLQNAENKTWIMKKALKYLDDRMGDITRSRQWLNKLEREQSL